MLLLLLVETLRGDRGVSCGSRQKHQNSKP
jgi:hypothetical protein